MREERREGKRSSEQRREGEEKGEEARVRVEEK